MLDPDDSETKFLLEALAIELAPAGDKKASLRRPRRLRQRKLLSPPKPQTKTTWKPLSAKSTKSSLARKLRPT